MDYTRNEDKIHRYGSGHNSLLGLNVIEDDDVTEPVTLAEVKSHLRVDFADDDAYLTMLIKSARASIEKYTGLSIVEKEIKLHINNSEGGYELPYGPVQGTPYVTNDQDEEVDSPMFSGVQFKALVSPTYSEVRLTYATGFDIVPSDLKIAILHEVAYLYEHRGDESDKEGLSPIAKGYAKRHRRVSNVL